MSEKKYVDTSNFNDDVDDDNRLQKLLNDYQNYMVSAIKSLYKRLAYVHEVNEAFSQEWYQKISKDFEKERRVNMRGLFENFEEIDTQHIYNKYAPRFAEQEDKQNEEVDTLMNLTLPDKTYCIQLMKQKKPLPQKLNLNQFAEYVFNINTKNPRNLSLKYGSFIITDWYNLVYSDLFDEYMQMISESLTKRTKKQRKPSSKMFEGFEMGKNLIDYPFTSKYKKYKKMNKDEKDVKLQDKLPDRKLMKNYLKKPYYSPHIGSWEMDHVFNLIEDDDSYLFIININTRFLVVFQCPERAKDVKNCLDSLLKQFPNGVKSLRGDGSVAYSNVSKPTAIQSVNKHTKLPPKQQQGTNGLLQWYDEHNIKVFFSESAYTNKNRIVDAAIRTIRNAIGKRNITYTQLLKLVWFYNNTPHNGLKFIPKKDITPIEMMYDEELEWQYIRYCDMKLLKAKMRQKQYGLDQYKPGNILIVHLDTNKTKSKFEKKRRIFDRLAEFRGYVNGNAKVKLLQPVSIIVEDDQYKKPKKELVSVAIVPLYCTRKISDDAESIPDNVKEVYNPLQLIHE